MQGRSGDSSVNQVAAADNSNQSAASVAQAAMFGLAVGSAVFTIMLMISASEKMEPQKSFLLAAITGLIAAVGTSLTTYSICARMGQSFRLFSAAPNLSTDEESNLLTPAHGLPAAVTRPHMGGG